MFACSARGGGGRRKFIVDHGFENIIDDDDGDQEESISGEFMGNEDNRTSTSTQVFVAAFHVDVQVTGEKNVQNAGAGAGTLGRGRLGRRATTVNQQAIIPYRETIQHF